MRFGNGGVDTSQVEDRRGRGGLGPIAVGGGGLGLTGLVIALLYQLLAGGGGAGFSSLTDTGGSLSCDKGADTSTACFTTAVVNDVQRTWSEKLGARYRTTKLVMFTSSTQSGCGYASSSTGPFYCPADSLVYIDLSFFDELSARFGAPGDFAQAYVVAHELGHHVQHLLGTSDKVRGNADSVKLELQADCYAGVWAHDTHAEVEVGDFDEALDAAAAVGDDRLQQQAGRRVDPDSWTHGSSEQRMTWFRRGAANGNPDDCDTFAT